LEITYLGHAGFCIETSDTIIVTDPWLSPEGAFDGAWFQFPRNHHMGPWVADKLKSSSKPRFVYLSHEHKDHCDRRFLDSLSEREFTLVVPKFRRSALREMFADYACQGVRALEHGQTVPSGETALTLYLDDSELNRDSAILIRADDLTFLNLNDCKLYDALPEIRKQQGAIDAFACQFSGATWHPTCYDYPAEEYARISRKKRLARFETVARALETLEPRYYIPSAGPACFLDPQLVHLNFQSDSIFPRAPALIRFLGQRLANSRSRWADVMPGDVIDVGGAGFQATATVRVSEDNREAHIRQYAADYAAFFGHLHRVFTPEELEQLRDRLQACLRNKLEQFPLRNRVPVPLYFGFSEAPTPSLRLDFPQKRITRAERIVEKSHYSITAPAWQVARVLDGQLTWEDFALTFRMRLSRSPDLYQALIQGFLIMEAEDLEWFCKKVETLERLQSRTDVEANGTPYRIDRYCPHQGGDLTAGWAERSHWTCPRHRWQFDLENDGRCTTSDCTIHAVRLQPD
jgi:UDP-MurNAc hydroxylase